MSRNHSFSGYTLARTLACALLAAVMLLPLSISSLQAAGNADFEQQLVAISNSQELDLKTNKVVLIGNVKVTQGSIVLLADRLDVFRTADGEAIERMIAYGKPAHYEQIMEDGNLVEADGDVLDYQMRDRLLIATGNAQITQENNLIKGQTIRYDLAKEQLKAESDNQNARDKVTTIFLPPPKDDDKE